MLPMTVKAETERLRNHAVLTCAEERNRYLVQALEYAAASPHQPMCHIWWVDSNTCTCHVGKARAALDRAKGTSA